MRSDARLSRLALRWMIVGEWRARPGRVVMAVLAIAVGVALGFAVHLVNRSALDEFGRALQAVNGEADLQVHSVSAVGFAEGLYPILARLDGVAVASPVVELEAQADGDAKREITLLGVDILRAAPATPNLVGNPVGDAAIGSQTSPFDEDALSLSTAALSALGRHVGESVTLTAAGRTAAFRIASTLPGAGEAQRVGVVDIATAQWLFGELGRLQRIDLKLAPGAEREAVEAAIRRVLPADAELVTPRNAALRSDSLSRAYRVNLEMLAMVALLTGGFLVYSAQSLSVTLRRPQFALVRVLGVTRRGLLTQLLVEGAAVGAGGSALGIGVGFGLAELVLRLLGGDLGGGFFAGSHPHLVFAPVAAFVFVTLGVAVALAGSLLPALEAARAQPAIALKTAGDVVNPSHRPSPWLGVGLFAVGAAASLAPPILGLPLAGYGAMALMLAGGVAAMPWLARTLLTPLRRLPKPPPALALALARLWGAPSQAAIALCGIVASVSLMVAMATMVSSFRGSVEAWLTQVLPSDVYLRLDSADAGLDPTAQQALAAAPGVAHVSFSRTTLLRLAADRPPVALTAIAIDPAHPGRTLPVLGESRPAPGGAVPVWLSEPMARLYRHHVGETFALPLGGAARPVFVAGIWRDYARQFGAIAMTDADFTRLTGDTTRGEAAIDLKPGVTPAAAMHSLRAALPPPTAIHVGFARPRQIRAVALRLFDRSFAATYALEAIAIVVGLTGVAATFSAQTLSRTKEFGMLRHIGVLRRQILVMLAIEGGLLGAVGVVAGLSLGIAMSQVLIHVINPQSFNWTMETRLPWPLFASLAVALIVAAAGTAVVSGRGATARAAIRTVREDW
jgi:putative ABC transport system permease protein